MARPLKRPEFDPVKNTREFTEAITEAYLFPSAELADEEGHMPLKYIADEFKITPLKVRKILITVGRPQWGQVPMWSKMSQLKPVHET